MNKYVVLFYGSYYESNWYEGHESNSKEELVRELNLQLELTISENEKHAEYQEGAYKIYDDDRLTSDEKTEAWWEIMNMCPYNYHSVNMRPFDEGQVFLFPDEFWEHVVKK